MKVLIAGSNGMIGSAVTMYLVERGYEVVRLVRSAPKTGEIFWDPDAAKIDQDALEGFDGVVNLASMRWPMRWTASMKEKMLANRMATNGLLAKALSACKQKPGVLIAASGMGYYPSSGDRVLTEESSAGTKFLADFQKQGEAAAILATFAGIRVVNLRIPMVIGGSALEHAGFRAGDGMQWFSWVGRDELASIIEFTLTHKELSGPVNAVSPNPLRLTDFARISAETLGRKRTASIPLFIVRMIMGESGEEFILSSRRIEPEKLIEAGYPFRFPELAQALKHEAGLTANSRVENKLPNTHIDTMQGD